MFRNTFKDVEYALRTCAGNGTRFEFECYDLGHLYNLAHFLDRGLVQRPLFVQSVFGILGGIGTHAEDVVHMKRTADRLFGGDHTGTDDRNGLGVRAGLGYRDGPYRDSRTGPISPSFHQNVAHETLW